MALLDLPKEVAEHLIASAAWQEYCRALVDYYTLVSKRFDEAQAERDLVILQRMKWTLRLVIEAPYASAKQLTPFDRIARYMERIGFLTDQDAARLSVPEPVASAPPPLPYIPPYGAHLA